MILISSDTTYNLLKRTLAITIFFKGNLAGASSFSNFLKTRPHYNAGRSVPYSWRKVPGFFTFPVNQYEEDAGDGACSLSFCSEKTKIV